MSDLASVQATVYGRVQGVFFRAFAATEAQELGLTGYVRNLPGGAVEVQAEGERKQLEVLIDCLEVGPPSAKVDGLSLPHPILGLGETSGRVD